MGADRHGGGAMRHGGGAMSSKKGGGTLRRRLGTLSAEDLKKALKGGGSMNLGDLVNHVRNNMDPHSTKKDILEILKGGGSMSAGDLKKVNRGSDLRISPEGHLVVG